MAKPIIHDAPFPGQPELFDLTSNTFPTPKKATPIVEEPKQVVKEKDYRAFKYLAFFIAILSAVLSAQFSFSFLSTVLPLYVSIPLSVIIIGTATLSPELAIILFRKHRYMLMSFTIIIGLIASIFSMLSTIAGQYNARSVSGNAFVVSKRAETEEKRILDEIARLNRSIDAWQERITLAAKDGRADANAVYLKTKDEKTKLEREQELAKIQSGIMLERDDFYTWIGNVTNQKPDTVEFTMATFPALLLDITAPVFAVISLVL